MNHPFLVLQKSSVSLLLCLFAALLSSLQAVEEQPYTLIKKYGPLEIRNYPSANLAQIQVQGESYRSILNQGFRSLASYIFGKNQAQQKIAMTAPVIYTPAPDSASSPAHAGTMAFVMPQHLSFEALPKPDSSSIILSRTRPVTVAHLSFGGFLQFAGYRTFAKKEKELMKLLEDHRLTPRGPIQHHYYTDPFNPFPRYAISTEILPP
ncbi:MAG: heme-binding protein [Methylacidiphilales bacterium]|nr:heme-binding protein [Candidatus Methylacidiphilales bacterium]MDW8349709.1 heme-binding protein [Verrucomicrobiae bacterium]